MRWYNGTRVSANDHGAFMPILMVDQAIANRFH